MSFLLSELATRFDLRLKGLPEAKIWAVASLQDAGKGDISFCTGHRHLSELEGTKATAVILHPDIFEQYQGNALLSENPHLAFARIARLLYPERRKPAGIHPSSIVHAEAFIHETASVAENVIIEKSVNIAAGCEIGAGSFLGEDTVIGEDTVLKNNTTIHHETVVGRNCILHSGCVIGSEGFGHAREGDHWLPIPQLGKVVIGNDVRIGANTTIDRGALGDTLIGNGVKIDNLVHIAHNVCIGDDTAIAACTGIAGSTNIGKRCTLAGQVGVVDNISICDDAHFTGQTAIRSDITVPGIYSAGILLEETRSWLKNATRFKQLNSLFKQVRDLSKKQD
ncbi:UDP-3-O-acylglucosamine N-acyltransferase [bacterium BMS3Bbin11]|nr:UDP-3-O-acylglucosamine N-acyltransferase [bacterium BMS3Abin11]GBE45495.1 UDP-3-O-acylglucosamine N-acyltransferase [bacterium BMS3Bbin11]GMT39792.1 MAG: UDP-3-O-acylglucosamine N-acyltransferase [bacterium]HDH08940.1 UDP-3-O-(3-hydroxymyristoyl)glucosamine N-acyltransferase [Gammaproteobacteria bacterium]HDH17107.1 UDP-3-O-(3-hydroxymyristoyl)glucosamine N-acyltransferase [Gammaproteobacteria bacterium]